MLFLLKVELYKIMGMAVLGPLISMDSLGVKLSWAKLLIW